MSESYVEKWDKCLDIIRENIGQARFDTFFKCAKALGFSDNTLTIGLPSHFFYEKYENEFYNLIDKVLGRVFGSDVKIIYDIKLIDGDNSSNVMLQSSQQSHAIKSRFIKSLQRPEVNSMKQAPSQAEDFDPQLNEILNFENYCVGKSNKLAHTIALYIAEHPHNPQFNPFFLYGPVGVGKTHLAQAIGIRLKEKDPRAKVLFTTLRQFQYLYANAVIQKKVPGFIWWFQQMDALIIDDLQEIAAKPGTCEALFPIFNHLHANGKQLVFTCDRPPVELDGVTDRLIDRFKWGITEELPRPDKELRRQILHFKARKNGLDLSDEILDLIAEDAGASVRELEGIVMGVYTRSIALGQPITVELVREAMSHCVKKEERKPLNFEMIVETTADFYNLNPDVIFTKSRVRDIADARMVIMYLAHKMTGLSSSAIGFKLNRRHATVLHGINAIKERIPFSKELSDAVASIEASLKR